MYLPKSLRRVVACLSAFSATWAIAQAQDIAITTRHSPTMNGNARVEGSVQQLLGEDLTLNGGAVLTGDLWVPGTPQVVPNGSVVWQGVQAGTGAVAPTGYTVRLNGGVALRYVRTRANAPALPNVAVPPMPTGTRNVSLNKAADSVGSWTTLRDLTLNGNAGTRSVPPGTYGNFILNGQTSLTLGIPGATQPAVYDFQALTLNGQSTLNIVGPVILTTGSGFNANGQLGVSGHADWLQVRVANGGVTLNSHATLHGSILAPNGTVIVNGQSVLCGSAACDRFTLNGGGLVRWCPTLGGGGNRPPVAQAQPVSTREDQGIAIVLAGSDPDGNAVTYTIATQPAHGSLSGAAPDITYTPNRDYHGPDSFTFTAHDGLVASPPATVAITVTPVNDPPTANPQTVVTTEDNPLIITLAGGDPDGDALSYRIVGSPLHGTVEKNTDVGSGPGDFTYWPAPNSSEPDGFTFRVQDEHGGVADGTVQVAITPMNDVPVATPLSITVDEDGEVAVTLSGTDPDGEPLRFEIIAASGPAHGTIGAAPDFIYRPALNYHGPDSFTYVAIDHSGDRSAHAVVRIQVRPIDDAPIAQSTVHATLEDTPVSFTVIASDADGEALTYAILTAPGHGTLSGTGPTFVYSADADFFGDDRFTYRAIDQADPHALRSAPATVTLHIESVNDAPIAQAQGVVTSEDRPVAIRLGGSDVDGDPLTAIAPSEPGDLPQHGTLVATEDPSVFLYTPAANYAAGDSFRFKVSDGRLESDVAEVRIVIQPIDNQPVAAPIALITDEDQPAKLTLSGVDIDDFELFFEVVAGSGPNHGTLRGTPPALTYHPAENFSGVDYFDYIAIDSLGLESPAAHVSITVLPRNDAPVATSTPIETPVKTFEDTPVEITLTATDVEPDPLEFSIITPPAHGTLEQVAPGNYRYRPNANFHGNDGFIYVANDGELDSAAATVAIRVAPVNDAPVTAPGGGTTREDTSVTITLQATDLDGDPLNYLPQAAANGTLIAGLGPGTFLYTPAANFHGSDTFSFTVRDAEITSAPALVTIAVTPVNDPPIVSAGKAQQTPVGAPAQLTGGAMDDGDAPGGALSFSWQKVSGPGLVGFSNPTEAATAAQFGSAGSYILRLVASDGEFSGEDDVQVIVAPGNQSPVVNAGADAEVNYPATLKVRGTATDDGLPAASTLRFAWRKMSGPGDVIFTAPQNVVTDASFSLPGSYVLRFSASDGVLAGTDDLNVVVRRLNGPPQVSAGPDLSIAADARAKLQGSASEDGLPAGAGLAVLWTKVSGPGAVSFTDAAAPSTEAAFSASGVYLLQLSANDSALGATDTVSVTVQQPANRAPTVNAGADQNLQSFRSAQLHGIAEDDGQPADATLTYTWSKVSGPGTATFANAAVAATSVSFGAAGVYTLRLSASDGKLSANDEVVVTMALQNQAPAVDAGADQTVPAGQQAIVSGEVTDDGLPLGQVVSLAWTKVSGPGTVTFGAPSAARTTAAFSENGDYVLRLTAHDSNLTSFDEVTVEVACDPLPAPTGLVGFWKGEDNAYDSRGEIDGLARNGVTYTAGKVGRAFFLDGVNDEVQVVAASSSSNVNVGTASGFTVECWVKPTLNSGWRPICEWGPGDGFGVHIFGSLSSGDIYVNVVDANGANHVVGTANNTMVAGVWQHLAFSFDKASSRLRIFRNGSEIGALGGAVLSSVPFTPRTTGDLHIGARTGSGWFSGALDEFSLYDRALTPAQILAIYAVGACGKTDGVPTEYPSVLVNAGADQTIFAPQPPALQGAVTDRRSDRSAPLIRRWEKVSGPGTVRFAPAQLAVTNAYFDTPGSYLLRLTAEDGSLTAADDVAVEVQAAMLARRISMQSGNGTANDPLNRFTRDGGATWLPANLTGNSAYPLLPGTSYIVGDFVASSSSRVRARFVLPAGVSNGRLNIQCYADNAFRVHLNGNQIAQVPGGLTTEQLWAYSGGAAFTAPATNVTVTDAALFIAGENILELENFNSFGPMGVDYVASVTFDAPGALGNQPPIVEAGADRSVVAPAAVALTGAITDDGLPLPGFVQTRWEKLSGPGTVVFSSPATAATTATFAAPGDYVLRLSVNDGEFAVVDTLVITVLPALNGPNQAPVVAAGADQGVGMLTRVSLAGLVADDGQPLTAPVVQWQKLSGPGSVGFADSKSATTDAVFGAAGTYVLALSASDGQVTVTDTVTVTVNHSTFANAPPTASAGPDCTVQLPAAQVTLVGALSDDGIPAQWPFATRWEILSAPGAAELRDANERAATARFTNAGDYVFRFTVNDGLLSGSDEVIVHVLPTLSADPLNVAPVVSAGNDQSVSGLGPILLSGSISDDGRPSALVTALWSKVSGPGTVQFADGTAAQTLATFNAPGVYVVRLTASDGLLGTIDEARIVAGQGGNQAPTISCGPDRTVAAGVSVTLTPEVSDDGVPTGVLELGWSVISGPGAVSLSGANGGGVTAQFGSVGAYTLRARVSDGQLEAFDDVVFAVNGGTNEPPLVELIAPAAGTSVPTGEALTLRANASDPEGALVGIEFFADDQFIASDSVAPFEISWTPATAGAHTLTAVAIDAIGQESSAPITVSATVGPPSVRLVSPLDGAAFLPGSAVPLAAAASSPVGIARVDFLADGVLVGTALTAPFNASWTSSAPGAHVITAVAIAADGQTGASNPATIYFLDDPGAPPLTEIASPVAGATITAPTAVLGNVQSPALRDWTLDYRRLGGECQHRWVSVATGTHEVEGGVLGTFDTTLLINGQYELRLGVRDRFGAAVSTSVIVSVEGNMKVGHFTVAFNDLTIPLAGIPITVTRSYDSRDQCPGDFGTSWKLDLEMLRLEKSHEMGAGWETIVTEGTLSSPSTYQLSDAAPHLLTVRMPDGDVLRFRPKLIVDRAYSRLASMLDADGDDVGQAWLPLQYKQPLKLIYRGESGTRGATLRAVNYRAVDPWFGGESTVAGNASFYVSEPSEGGISLATRDNSAQTAPQIVDATGWELTTRDGRIFTFDENGRLLSMCDLSGNTLTIVRDGAARVQKLVHSAGKEIAFHRDANGRIGSISDPSGNQTHYGYDALGRLTAFFDRSANPASTPTAAFTYTGETHLLNDLYDGKGIRAAKNYYDAEGRIQRTVDATGKETVFTHNIAGRTETIRDRAGNVTTHQYDERGNVTRTVQPDGSVVTTAYHVYGDGRKSALKTSEAISGLFSDGTGALVPKTLTTSYSYEDEDPSTPLADDGLLRKLVDPLGHATTFRYDAQGNVLTLTDPLGHTTTNTYQAGSNLLATTTDAAGNVTGFTYDPRGQLDKETHTVTVAGVLQTLVTDYDYDASGYLIKTTDAAGHTTNFQNDTRGNRLFERTTRTVNGAPAAIITEHEYDANDRLVKTWDAEHPRAEGFHPASETVYDDSGKQSLTYDALRRTMQMTYTARGELQTTTYADGTSSSVSYDAAGRREFGTDRRGKVTQTIYDALGRATAQILRGSAGDTPVTLSVTTYDGAGRVHTSTDANGNLSTSIYDDAGRRSGVRDALGHTSSYQYDAAGRKTSFTDALGHVTSFTYDALNRRIGTSFADNTTTSTTYDELGRHLTETDPNGLSKSFSYDVLGRLVAVTDALGQVTRYSYDQLGNQLTQTDANQHTTSYRYDNLGRRITRTLPLGQMETTGYNAAGNVATRTDFNGTISSYAYDAVNRLLTRTSNHASATASNVAFTYTASGQRATMTDASGVTTYTYDARDRLSSKATPQGTLSYSYDPGGNVATVASDHAQGASTSYAYDALNRLDAVTDVHLGTTRYAYDNVGNLRSYAAPNGTSHAYAYNTVNRLSSMAVWSSPANGAPTALTSYAYTLTPGGQRVGAAESGLGILPTNPAGTRSISYTYDALLRLTQETTAGHPGHNGTVSYTHDPVGNRLARTSTVAGLIGQSFSYDANDRLTTDTYDANGNTRTGKVSLDANGAETAAQTASDSYDSENRLTARTGPNNVQVIYDGDRHKVRETINGQEFSYLVDDQNPTGYAQVLEELQNGAVIRTYSYGHDLLAQDQRDGTGNWSATFYGYDGHGSVRFLTDDLGALTDTYTYDAFGTLLTNQGTTFNRYRYCGEQYDSALGLYYLRARYLNAANGRFWSADSYEGQNRDPASLHKYLYCGSDPTNRIDPSGCFSLTELAVANSASSSIRLGGLVTTLQQGSLLMAQAQAVTVSSHLRQAALEAILQDDWAAADGLLLWNDLVAQSVSEAETFNDTVTTAVGTAGLYALVRAIPRMIRAGPSVLTWVKNLPTLLRKTSSVANKAPISWNPITGSGPLGDAIAGTFRSSTYAEIVTDTETILYRVYSDPAKQLGGYWTRAAPSGPVQSIVDSALDPLWGNRATNTVTIRLPAGQTIFEGVAAPQRGLVGGGNQVFLQNVHPSWIVQ